ncbi:SGNH/GDSL hydrolase family protein [Frigoribacterium sp. Leaf44]|uniref:SGNH/GDSL hydrolase family protein n=1 Tax=Frigoribacterium sp. Leaf44 TaxID=1736220 RepID=UPI000B181DA4|nr:SGNH/GDSL hydrolase family protein [Frigoribacterium sp. Leaf44]
MNTRTPRKAAFVVIAGTLSLATGIAAIVHHRHHVAVQAAACESVGAYERSTGGSVHTRGKASGIAVIGDSYSAGDHLSNRDEAWVNDFSGDTGLSLNVFAESGTGIVNPGFCGNGRYEARISSALLSLPDSLMIQGGLNDVDASDEELTSETRDLLNTVRVVPRVFVIGPPDTPARQGEDRVDDILRKECADLDIAYISALHWPLEFGPDQEHLTATGHAEFATSLEASLEALSPSPFP